MFSPVSPKQSFPALESEILAYWKANNIFQKSIDSRPENNPYRFYDGPPFITGTPHYGSLLSSIVKDAVGRYWTMRGKRVYRVWGWDCHGLPIEEKVQKKLGLHSNKEIEERGVKEFIDGCYEYTQSTSAEWNWYIDKIGRWVDMDHAYRTMDQEYMESVMWVFKQLWDQGLIYEGKRVSLYSWKLSTPISNFEVAMDNTYQEVNDPAITVKFTLEKNEKFPEGTAVLAWTTTPWTIPANMALAVRNDIEYTLIENNNEHFIVAKNRIEAVFKGKGEYTIVREFAGSELIGLGYVPPFPEYYYKKNGEKNHKIYHADFITDTDGTGIGHEAPEFGDVDFQLAKQEGIFISEAMDEAGKYTTQIFDYVGIHYQEANKINIERLKKNTTLFKNEGITHRVPFCPRSGTPLVQKAQTSWFIDIQSKKEALLEANKKINWFPEHLKFGRFAKGIEAAPDWCISRTRYWGAPMPVWINDAGEKFVVGSREEIFEMNVPYKQLEKKEINGKTQYFFVGGKYDTQELNLHKPYIDSILLSKKQAVQPKKVLGIHGWTSRGLLSGDEGFWEYVKNECAKESIEMDVPDFDKNKETSYKNWKATLDTLNIKNYDTIVAHSFGCPVVMQYIIENAISLDRLVLVAPSGLVGNNYLEKIASEMTADTASLKKFVKEIIIIHSKDDISSSAPYSYGKNLAKEIQASLVTVDGYGHAMNGGGSCIVHATVQYGAPLVRTPEVLDVWMDSGSMPYAQMHYPFENKDKMEASFPADFITEYVGQIRAWFYVMHVLGVLLNPTKTSSPTPSFTNVITTGVINGNDGRKMSKSFGNYPDPRLTIEKYGADPIRFYMLNSPLLSGGDMDFKEEGIVEAIKSVMLPLWNTYSFFTTYANIDGWEKEQSIDSIDHPLDRWIISRLHVLIEKVHTSMDEYNIPSATRAIVDYMDNLTNWYVRLSRRRFWGSQMTTDKQSAYTALYHVLVETSKLLAPFMPFLSENIFCGLTKKESVHLEYTTNSDASLIDTTLNSDMAIAKNIVSLGLTIRSRKNIRVRQPLTSVTITTKLSEYYQNIICDELNVKEILYKDPENIAQKICKPDARKIGPKYGKDVQKIIIEAKNGNFTEGEDNTINVAGVILYPEEYTIEYLPAEGMNDVEGNFGIVIAMNTHITEELKIEGYARDIIRQIQDMRKEVGYQVTDRILLSISRDQTENILAHKQTIESETLSTLVENIEIPDIEKNTTFNDTLTLNLKIKKLPTV